MADKKRIEILAPAGGPEQLKAAVRSGANAVYLGAPDFNARRNAENFDRETLKEAIRYCHGRGVRVYVAFNTLITDAEFGAAENETRMLAAYGADGVIVQDLAVARMIRDVVPSLPLHASTQTSVHNVSGVKALEKLGFVRAVPSRELSLKELGILRKSTDMELEVFVHGALCMCVSGQCYLSAMLGGRSANRGLCAQPCRLDFSSGNGGHALSLKDLSAIPMIRELEALGVNSAKIEGRMKRPEYVAAATRACVQARAGLPYDAEQLRAVFSRGGFTNGYLEGKIGRDMFGFRSKEDVVAAAPVLKEIAAGYRNEAPLVGVDMRLTVKSGEPAKLTVTDGENAVTVSGVAPERAIKRELDVETAKASLAKCGGTPFFLKNAQFEIEAGLAMPTSAINALRGAALEALLEKRGATVPKEAGEFKAKITPYPAPEKPRLYARFESAEQLCEADVMILDFEELFARPDLCEKYAGRLAAELPALAFDERGIGEKLEALYGRGIRRVYAPNIYAVELGKRYGFEVTGGFGLNALNSLAVAEYARLGVGEAEISVECGAARFEKMKKAIPCGIVAYGHLPLMTFRACPVKGKNGCGNCDGRQRITDRRGEKMTVLCHERRYSRLLNPVPLYMADKTVKGAAFLTLYFTTEDKTECERVIRAFRRKEPPEGRFTRGLYYKELK